MYRLGRVLSSFVADSLNGRKVSRAVFRHPRRRGAERAQKSDDGFFCQRLDCQRSIAQAESTGQGAWNRSRRARRIQLPTKPRCAVYCTSVYRRSGGQNKSLFLASCSTRMAPRRSKQRRVVRALHLRRAGQFENPCGRRCRSPDRIRCLARVRRSRRV